MNNVYHTTSIAYKYYVCGKDNNFKKEKLEK